MKSLDWCQRVENQSPIIKVPLQFTFPPVQILMKQLTRLNSPHPYRIIYLGPRWDNSVLFHKKYSAGGAYEFRQRKVSKNTSFLHDSMIHNQFYKNQIYYRAFEGMNPTINLENELIFQSRFEGGNLDCVVKISQNQYDLFLRIDSNTKGHIFWFYFAVKNLKKGKRIKFNLANLTKNDTHYTKGLNPYMFSSQTNQWTQQGMHNVTFKQKRLRYEFLYQKIKIRNFYELSFQVEPQSDAQLKFAYCIPYNYSDLLRDLKIVSDVAEIGSLGQTLTGINIPMIMVGKHQETKNKPVLLITGRIHPGESNSSLIISSLIKFLCFSPQAKFMREKVLTIIIPMANPDGVILGNSRCAASGKDLNRQFKTISKALFPEVVLLKNLVDKISETHDIDIYLDFHGHSRKKNMFIFGPSYNLTQPEYYKCRVFPKLLSNYTNVFRYYSCSYDIPYEKRSTARAVMLNELFIPFVYTVETSLGFYHDYNLHKDMFFTMKKWQQLGESIVLALSQYYEGIEQYDLYIQGKKKAKKAISEQIKANNAATALNNLQIVSSIKKNQKQSKKEFKDLKILKIFDEIKELQDKRGKQQKKQKDSDNESDSHDEKQQFEKQKMHEFADMVTQFIEQQNRIINNQFQKTHQNNKKIDQQKNYRRKLRRQQRQQRQKYQQNLIKQVSEDNKGPFKRFEVKSQSKKRYHMKQQISLKKDRTYLISQEMKRPQPKEINLKSKEKRLILHQYLDEEVDFISVQKKSNKSNVRMFNFSKMVQNPKSLRYQDQKDYIRIKDISHNFIDSSSLKKKSQYSSQFSNYPRFQDSNQLKPAYLNLESYQYHGKNSKKDQSFQNTDQLKQMKGRIGFPSSFYRIKYHNNQRKKLESKKEKQLYEFQQYQKIHQYNNQNNYGLVNQKQSYQNLIDEIDQQNDGLFLQVKKFPVF